MIIWFLKFNRVPSCFYWPNIPVLLKRDMGEKQAAKDMKADPHRDLRERDEGVWQPWSVSLSHITHHQSSCLLPLPIYLNSKRGTGTWAAGSTPPINSYDHTTVPINQCLGPARPPWSFRWQLALVALPNTRHCLQTHHAGFLTEQYYFTKWQQPGVLH